MEDNSETKRITFKRTRPNPKFENWIQELYDVAVLKGSENQDAIFEALTALKKYPLTLKSGKECAILRGFGKKLCAYVDSKIADSMQVSKTGSSLLSKAEYILPENLSKQNKQSKLYLPAFRSGGYAILVALLKQSEHERQQVALSKEEIIENGQLFCEESFTKPKLDSRYTAWSSMSRLLSKDLIKKINQKKPQYILTDDGCKLAKHLIKLYQNKVTADNVIEKHYNIKTKHCNENPLANINPISALCINSRSDDAFVVDCKKECMELNTQELENSKSSSKIVFLANSFDIILLIDKQETSGVSNKNDPTVRQFEKYNRLQHEYKHLKVGDFTWIARERSAGKELVLPYIVERKRMDDLAASIKDGRFHEQKFRLKSCGIPNVIYLIESFGSNKHVGMPVSSLMQAVTNTRVQNKFMVHFTDSLAHSVKFLAMMTKKLTLEFSKKQLTAFSDDLRSNCANSTNLMEFSYFNKSAAKTKPLTVTDMFIKLLLQIKGVSVEKALAVVSQYKTPRLLMNAYEEHSSTNEELLLANLKYNTKSKNVGPAISKTIYQLFTTEVLL